MDQYLFSYMTPQAGGDPIPTQFALAEIPEDVVLGIAKGLQTVPTITNVTLHKVTTAYEEITIS